VALTLRGARVDVLLCDEALPACQQALVTQVRDPEALVASGPSRELCLDCFWPAFHMYRGLGVRVRRYRETLDAASAALARKTAAATPIAATEASC
jgi:hypothetical protein